MTARILTLATAACLLASSMTSASAAAASLSGDKIGEVYATPETIEVRIGREFPAFDTDFSGELDLYEFSKWLNPLIDLRLKYDEASATRDDIDSFIETAFKKADADKNGEIGPSELAIFFGADIV